MVSGGWIAARIRVRLPQRGHSRTSTAKTRRRRSAHASRRGRLRRECLRGGALVHEWRRSLAKASERGSFRVTHYSLQGDHAHLIVEAHGKEALARGMMSIGARLARAVNRVEVPGATV